MLQKLHTKIKNNQVKSLWHRCAANSAHLFVMQSSGSIKYHAVEGAPTFWTCHLAIKTTYICSGQSFSGEQGTVVEVAAQRIVCRYANTCTSGTPTKYFW
jgi:hypothetical protein